jgi:tetratricopeptide (TPR) repeat protein
LLEWSLRPAWRAGLVLISVIAVSVFLTYKTARVAQATDTLLSLSIPTVQKGLEYDPGNPDLIHRLGVLYSFVPTQLNLPEALKYLRQAVALNPRHWDYWADLGTVCDFVGDTACSDKALGRAQSLNPTTPRLQWIIGNHYVLTNRPQLSFPYFRRLLDMSPDYAGPAFRLLLRAADDPEQVYTQILAQNKNPSLRFAFLTFLGTTGDYESAMRIWATMISDPGRSPELSSVKPFLDFLIEHDQIEDAKIIWDGLGRRGLVAQEHGADSHSLVYNGSFERPPLNAGFDWRYSEEADLLFDFSDPSGRQGGKCLRIEFLVGRNEDFDLVNQVVPVAPHAQYHLTAYLRSEGLTSDSGPRLRVSELGCPNCPVVTSEQTLGTTDWHSVDATFTTQPQTQAVRVSLWRSAGRTIPRDISGTVWLDDVNLEVVETPGRASQERSR